MKKHGYKLIAALREEADEIAVDARAELVRDAANEIENLLRELADEREKNRKRGNL